MKKDIIIAAFKMRFTPFIFILACLVSFALILFHLQTNEVLETNTPKEKPTEHVWNLLEEQNYDWEVTNGNGIQFSPTNRLNKSNPTRSIRRNQRNIGAGYSNFLSIHSTQSSLYSNNYKSLYTSTVYLKGRACDYYIFSLRRILI